MHDPANQLGEPPLHQQQQQQRQFIPKLDAQSTAALLAQKVSQATLASEEFFALVTQSAEEVRAALVEEQAQVDNMLACYPRLGEIDLPFYLPSHHISDLSPAAPYAYRSTYYYLLF